jgi:hypothetical protein
LARAQCHEIAFCRAASCRFAHPHGIPKEMCHVAAHWVGFGERGFGADFGGYGDHGDRWDASWPDRAGDGRLAGGGAGLAIIAGLRLLERGREPMEF